MCFGLGTGCWEVSIRNSDVVLSQTGMFWAALLMLIACSMLYRIEFWHWTLGGYSAQLGSRRLQVNVLAVSLIAHARRMQHPMHMSLVHAHCSTEHLSQAEGLVVTR